MNSIAINFVDCAIIVLYLIFIIWWGLRNGKSSDAGSYFLAGRTMPWWIVGLSLFAASISSTTLIGQSGDAYHTGVASLRHPPPRAAVRTARQSTETDIECPRHRIGPPSLRSCHDIPERTHSRKLQKLRKGCR